MPCRDYMDDEPGVPQETYNRTKARLNKVTKLLCDALKKIEGTSIETHVILEGGELAEWWILHKQADAKAREIRLEKQRIARKKKEALAKLDKEERKLLGL